MFRVSRGFTFQSSWAYQAIVGASEVVGGVVRRFAAGRDAQQQGRDALEGVGPPLLVEAWPRGLLGQAAAERELAVCVAGSDIALGFIVNFEAEAESVSASGPA